MVATLASAEKIQQAEQLHDAFQRFNELSQNLSDSYQELQAQVAKLNLELQEARSARLQTLTEKEQLANQLHGLLEALPGAVIVVDVDGEIVRENAVVGEMFGDSLIGRKWSQVMYEHCEAKVENPREIRLKSGKYVNLSLRSLNPDPGQIVLLTDVSELHSLQDLVHRQKRLSAMGEMVAGLAHQVRTPLTTAILYASQLGTEKLAPNQRDKFSKKLLERLHFLERQVNDMLIFARDGRLAMEKVGLPHLVSRIEEAARMVVLESDLCLECDHSVPDVTILGNEDTLTSIVMNLIANAVEMMDGHGTIRIHFSEQAIDSVRISVVDNGPGVPEQHQDRLFEPFFTTRTSGTGLGLAVVESVVTAHQGRVWCETQHSKGAAFHIELPRVQDITTLSGEIFRHKQKTGVI